MTTAQERAFKHQSFSAGDFALNGVHLALREASRPLPYEKRMKFARHLGRYLLRAVPGYRARARDNLALVFPDHSEEARIAIAKSCFEHIGQSLFEHMFIEQFAERLGDLSPQGEGLEALANRGQAIFITGHFGQWEGVRIAARGLTGRDCAFLYRPNNNGFYDRHWRRYLEVAGRPAVAKGRDGRAQMHAHLDAGGSVLFANDQRRGKADYVDFLGHPARTATTAAELALEYDLPLIPAYARRLPNMLDYEVTFEAAIKSGAPLEMIGAANASLGALVAQYPEQYLWTHRRWR